MTGFGNPLWKQVQKIELKADGTLTAPVKADGTDGIVIGEPPLGVPPKREKAVRRPGPLSRLVAGLRGRA